MCVCLYTCNIDICCVNNAVLIEYMWIYMYLYECAGVLIDENLNVHCGMKFPPLTATSYDHVHGYCCMGTQLKIGLMICGTCLWTLGQ